MHFIIDPYRFGETDPLSAYVTILLHCNGADGGYVFTEESGRTVTLLGAGSGGSYGAFTSTTQIKFGSASGRFQYSDIGSHGGLKIANTNNPVGFGLSDYCIEFWGKPDAAAGEKCPLDLRASAAPGVAGGQLFLPSAAGTMRIYTGNNTLRLTAGTLTTNWQHWALDAYTDPGSPTQRVATLYLDGTAVGSFVDSVNYASTNQFHAARSVNNTRFWTGYLDEIRITKGMSRYQGSNFTPQTAEFPYP